MCTHAILYKNIIATISWHCNIDGFQGTISFIYFASLYKDTNLAHTSRPTTDRWTARLAKRAGQPSQPCTDVNKMERDTIVNKGVNILIIIRTFSIVGNYQHLLFSQLETIAEGRMFGWKGPACSFCNLGRHCQGQKTSFWQTSQRKRALCRCMCSMQASCAKMDNSEIEWSTFAFQVYVAELQIAGCVHADVRTYDLV